MRSAREEVAFGLLVTVFMVLVLSTLAPATARMASTEMAVVGNYRGLSRAFYAADGTAQAAVDRLVTLGRQLGRFPTAEELAAITPPTIDNTSFPSFDVQRDGVEVIEPLQSGYFQGLNAYTMPFSVDVTAESTNWPRGRSSVSMGVLFDIIPIFQFAVFYDDDLEILPGPAMLLNGRVHSNADIYLNAGDSLTVDSAVTSGGHIYHGRKDSIASMGTVDLRDADGDFVAMNGLDSSDDDWYEEALQRWDGNVRSSAHGIVPLGLTIADPTAPRMLIELPAGSDGVDEQASKLYYRADLVIANGAAFDAAGDAVSTIDPGDGADALRATVIYDPREQRHMLTYELDLDVLSRTPAWPDNGLVYAASAEGTGAMPSWSSGCSGCWGPAAWDGYATPWSSNATGFALKVTNGAELAAPLTVATANPMYVRGDYNTVNKVGAALVGDALTVLSNAWGSMDDDEDEQPDQDLAYSSSSLNDRVASNTTLNAAVMLGNTATTSGHYNGGLENVLRFIEKWSGRTLTYRGSIIDLWFSEQASGDWQYGNPIYEAPTRAWSFDTDFLNVANLPPFTPRVYTVRVSDWRRG